MRGRTEEAIRLCSEGVCITLILEQGISFLLPCRPPVFMSVFPLSLSSSLLIPPLPWIPDVFLFLSLNGRQSDLVYLSPLVDGFPRGRKKEKEGARCSWCNERGAKMRLPPDDVIAGWPPPDYDHPQTRGPYLVLVQMILMPLALLALLARLYVRGCLMKKVGADDWLMLAAMVRFYPLLALLFESLGLTRCGIGVRHRDNNHRDPRVRGVRVEDSHLGSDGARPHARAEGVHRRADTISFRVRAGEDEYPDGVPAHCAVGLVVPTAHDWGSASCWGAHWDLLDRAVDAVHVSFLVYHWR